MQSRRRLLVRGRSVPSADACGCQRLPVSGVLAQAGGEAGVIASV